MVMNLRMARTLYALGRLDKALLPGVALVAMNDGLDAPALRQLAGLAKFDLELAPRLFEQALKEVGMPTPERMAAAREYAVLLSRQMIAGEVSPEDGARKLWDVASDIGIDQFHDLDAFIYCASEIPSRPLERRIFVSEILREAADWASKGLNGE
jgi:hypothetical protein